MARVALNWGVRDLAEAAAVSTNTVTRFEGGEALKDRTVSALQDALEKAGAILIDTGEVAQGYGVVIRA